MRPVRTTLITAGLLAVHLAQAPVVAAQESPSPSPSQTDSHSPGSSSPSGEPPATVTVTASHAEVTAGNAPQLAGRVADAAGNGVGGKSIAIYAKGYGIGPAYGQIASVQSDADGRFILVVRPMEQTAYVARYSTEVGSTSVVIRVHTRITLDWPRPDERRAGPWHVGGNLEPRLQSVPVGLAAIVGGRYVFLGQAVTNDGGQFTVVAAPPAGELTLLVYTSARQGLLRGARSLRETATEGRTVTVTAPNAFSESLVLHRGEHLVVNLQPDQVWSGPTVNGTAVSEQGRAVNPNGSVTSLFVTVAVGQAEITARGRQACWPDTCPGAPEYSLRVQVTVVA